MNHQPPPRFWKLAALLTLGGLVVVVCVWILLPATAKPKPKAGAAWQTMTEDDRLVDAFRKARNEDITAGKELLAADPVFDEKVPVSEQEAEALQAGYFLHRVRKVLSVRGGEPAPGGGWLNTPQRFTLATRSGISTPLLSIKTGDRVGFPFRLLMIDPDIVVEVRKGKLHALRTELHSD